MKNLIKKFRQFSKSPVASIVVLVGFLSIQFHSFSHIGIHAPPQNHNNTESVLFTEYNSNHLENVPDCTVCVLTKHVQADLQEHSFEYLNSNILWVNPFSAERIFAPEKYRFNLRAPPSVAV